MQIYVVQLAVWALLLGSLIDEVRAQSPVPAATPASRGEQSLQKAAADKKFAFILFFEGNDAATTAVSKTLKSGLAHRTDRAVTFTVNAQDPTEKRFIEKYQLSRAPLPLVLALAPNGAVTATLAGELTPAQIDNAIVTPTMTVCMKELQSNKLVAVYISQDGSRTPPPGVKALQVDPFYKTRTAFVSLHANDPAEARFLKDMQIDGATMKSPVTALLAPPGVLVGKFDAQATKDDITNKLHAAGKCDDPSCKCHKKGK